MRIVSWNVNGIRAVFNKDFKKSLALLNADIICFQETKAQSHQVEDVVASYNYFVSSNEAERKGYSGTAILSRTKPQKVWNGLGHVDHDSQGRVITAEFDAFFVVNAYVPNSGQDLKRLDYRAQWDLEMLAYLKNLELEKPVIFCGDLNVCHQEIDIARPKANYNKTAGYTQVEIDGINRMIQSGLVDTFRHLHPDEVKYSWWSYRGGAREKNIGWRLDYFLVSQSLVPKVLDAYILNEIKGSDHCPVGITLN